MRWILRIFLSIFALMVLAIVVIQLVLWSSIPKNLVVNSIQQELGLRVTTDRLTTGWLGKTTLRNVSLALPMADQSFLGVKTLKVKHTSLWGLLLGRALSVDSIELDEPNIVVRQDASGQWNLAEVAQLLAKAGGGETAQQSQQTGVPKLPSIKLIDGVISISDNQQHKAELPLNVDGMPEGPLVWKYNVKIGDAISLVGKLAPGLNWQQEITLQARDLDSLLKTWGIHSYDAAIAGHWQGQLKDGKIVGRLALDRLSAVDVPGTGNVSIDGFVDIEGGAGAVTFHPEKIEVKTSNPALPNLRLTAGTITSDASGIRADAMQLAVLGGLAVVDAHFDPKTLAADLSARWSDLVLSNHVTHSGSLIASLRTPFEGHPSIRVTLDSEGKTLSGGWQADVALAGNGQSWHSIDWDLTAPTLRWSGKQNIQFAQLVGHIRQRGPQIELTDLNLPERPHLVSRAAINLTNNNWFFWLDAGGEEAASNTMVPISLSINAWGTDQRYTLQDLNLSVSEAVVWAGGFYDRQSPNPVSLDVYLMQSPQLSATSPIKGRVGGSFHISGLVWQGPDKVFHPHLDITGSLKSSDLIVLDRTIGDMNMQLTGSVDNTDADLSTSQMSLLQGKWSVQAHRRPEEPIDLKIAVRDLPIEEIARLAKVNNVGGQVAAASWEFNFPSSFNLNRVKMKSDYRLTDLTIAGLTVDETTAKLTLADGYLKLDQLKARSGKGTMTTSVTYDLNNRERLDIEGKIDQWTFGTSGGAIVQLSADTKVDINLKQKSAIGPVNASADLLLNNALLAHTDLAAAWRGRLLDINKISGEGLNGTITGTAAIDLDRPLAAEGNLQWTNVDASAMGAISPELIGLGGRYSGTFTFAPAADPRPLEPVRIDLNVHADDGHFKSIKIGSGLVAVHAVAYANTDRAVLDHSDIQIAGGIVHVWARLGRNLISQTAQVDFENLQLDQIAQVNPNAHGEVPGLVSGRFAMIGSGVDLSELVGTGRVQLTQTDLGNFGPVAALYNAMHRTGRSKPTGSGSADLNLEQNILTVRNFRFFNRGVDAIGVFSAGPDVWNVQNALIGGQVAGSLRPLKNSRVSFLSDLDELFSSVQGELTTINISGTVGNPSYHVATLAELGNALKELINGDTRSGNASH